MTISAEVKRESEQKDGERVLRSERYYGAVYRSFVLPVELDEERSQAKYENGVLELTLAKKPPGRRPQADDPVIPHHASPRRTREGLPGARSRGWRRHRRNQRIRFAANSSSMLSRK